MEEVARRAGGQTMWGPSGGLVSHKRVRIRGHENKVYRPAACPTFYGYGVPAADGCPPRGAWTRLCGTRCLALPVVATCAAPLKDGIRKKLLGHGTRGRNCPNVLLVATTVR